MRPKVVLAILLVAAGVMAVAVMLTKVSKVSPAQPVVAPPQIAAAPSHPALAAPAFEPAIKPMAAVSPAPAATNGDTNAIALQEAEHEEYVEKRTEELNGLIGQKSPEAHLQVVAELKNPDKEIREAALDALEQTSDRSVVPAMQQIADQTTDPDEKQAIKDAIDFINLPSLTEYLQQRKAQKAAQGNQPSSQPPPNNTQTGQ